MGSSKRAETRARRLEIFEANYGRDTDWWVELDGRRLARLTDPAWVDMFWWRYRIEVVDEETRPLVEDRDLWLRGKLSFRSVPFGVLAEHAFCGGNGPVDGIVTMRAMAIDIAPPTIWERIVRRYRGSWLDGVRPPRRRS